MQVVYSFSVILYYWTVKIASLFNEKARLWVNGRKNGLDEIALDLDYEATYVWFHCASLGEFEQGRPVIEKFRKENPGIKIVLTFFSPSGYQIRKDYPLVDHVFYMPLDTKENARRFVDYVNPRMAVFVKYEYWFNHLDALHEKNIPIVFISSIFRPGQMFFSWWGGWFRKQLKRITYFFVQDKKSRDLLYSIGINNVVVSGDTRFDRVFDISKSPSRFEKVESFIQGSVIFMAGSTWPADEQMIVPFINQYEGDLKFIIVPHEIHENHIARLKKDINKSAVLYSQYSFDGFKDAKVLIIDQMGMLSSLYQYASIAYIGGGFGKGIHNTLEAAAFGMPVLFGPNYRKFAEAADMVSFGCAFPVKSKEQFMQVTEKLISDYNLLKEASDIAKQYVVMKRGATNTILVFLNTIINPGNFKSKSLEMLNMN